MNQDLTRQGASNDRTTKAGTIGASGSFELRQHVDMGCVLPARRDAGFSGSHRHRAQVAFREGARCHEEHGR